MSGVVVDPAALASHSAQIASAGLSSAGLSAGMIEPPAADPVSVAAAQTLSVRQAAIAAHTAAGAAVTGYRSDLLAAGATAYAEQEAANTAGLILGASPPAAVAAPSVAAPPAPVAQAAMPPVVAGPSPGDGKTIATLIHAGSTTGLEAGETQLRQHAAALSATANQLRNTAAALPGSWQSAAGDAAAARLRELGTWYDGHAQHTRAAAAACAAAAGNYRQATAAIPTPQAFTDTERQLANAMAAAKLNPAYLPAVQVLQTRLGDLHTQAITGYGGYQAASATLTGSAPQPPPQPKNTNGHINALDSHTFKQGPDKPPPPDPVGKLGLPDYNPGSLSDNESRVVYAQGELRMRELEQQMIRQGIPVEERAKVMHEQRNALRSWTRDLMKERASAGWLEENRPNLTWDQAMQKEIGRGKQGEGIYQGIIDSSTQSNAEVNAANGVDPENPPELPPVRPSAPIEPPIEAAPKAEAPPLLERGGEGGMGAGPSSPVGPRFVDPGHRPPHIVGDWDPDPEDIP